MPREPLEADLPGTGSPDPAPLVGAPPDRGTLLTALLREAAQGDETAFSRLYDEAAPLLMGLVRRVVRDEALSEEVLQEAFVEIWRQAPRFDPSRGSAHGWLCTIAHRRAVDTVRSTAASRRRDGEDGMLRIQQEVVDVQEEGIMRIESRRVRDALDSLSPVQSAAIRLAYFDGCSQSEVAQALGIPLGTAKSRIRDGMAALRSRIGVDS